MLNWSFYFFVHLAYADLCTYSVWATYWLDQCQIYLVPCSCNSIAICSNENRSTTNLMRNTLYCFCFIIILYCMLILHVVWFSYNSFQCCSNTPMVIIVPFTLKAPYVCALYYSSWPYLALQPNKPRARILSQCLHFQCCVLMKLHCHTSL